MKVIDIKPIDVLNGTGTRMSIWLAGCDHQCPGCFAKHTWVWTGKTVQEADLYAKVQAAMTDTRIKRDGISILGGDPLYRRNRNGLFEFLLWFKANFPDKTVWLWTGYTMEEIANDVLMAAIYELTDVVVDGRFVEELKDPDLPFRGSSNQTINVRNV